LRKISQRRRRAATSPTSSNSDLLTFIPQASPQLESPIHLQPLIDLFMRVDRGETVKAVVSTPPQHGKSQTCLHGLVWLLHRNSKRRHAYATYAQQFSRDQSYLAAQVAQRSRLQLNRNTADRWATAKGGGVVWTSRGGPLTGHPIDGLLLIDDLLKDKEEATSKLIRDKAMGWLSSVAFTRMHPGSSVILLATRWHLDDPIGQIKDREGWEYIALPAIRDDGTALWPEHRNLEWLKEKRKDMLERDWAAMFMCQPIADGNRQFLDATYYDELPTGAYQEASGFDASYTDGKGDYSVTITGRRYGEKIYITNMIRQQMRPEDYIPLMQAAGIKRVTWRRSGTEKGYVSLLRREGIKVTETEARTSKLDAASGAIVAWNRGDILLPKRAAFTPIIESECSQFTGKNDRHDDIVDAMGSLTEALIGSARQRVTSARTAERLYR
jgi:hypothetical protein